MNDPVEVQKEGDGLADAIAAIVLISVFVTACVFWISSNSVDKQLNRTVITKW